MLTRVLSTRGGTRGMVVGLSVLVMLAAASAALASGHGRREYNATPPLVVCGQSLRTSVDGYREEAFVQAGHYTLARPLRAATRPPAVSRVLRFAAGCAVGATISMAPQGDMTILASAHASDHQLTAVTLFPRHAGTVRITVRRASGPPTVITAPIAR